MPPDPKSSYRQIFKSSALIGGSSVVNVLLSMVRVKFTALYLGTAGVGLMGAYMTITSLVSTIAGMGISSSGVRQMAEAAGANDSRRAAATAQAVRRTAFVCGMTGMLLMLVLAVPISQWTFGHHGETWAMVLLSISVLISSISGGQTALIQGMRRIGDLARLNIWSGVLGTMAAILLMIWLGADSVLPILLSGSILGILTSTYFAKWVALPEVRLNWRETWQETRPLIKLGAVFMATSLMAAGVAYLTRVLIIRRLGLDAAGLYTAAWSLSSFYVGFIMAAMGADFYPRLTAAANDHAEVNRLVNEQAETGMLMALPGLVATLALSPLVIQIFYSAKFLGAVEVLRWQVLGLVLRVISWPVGFIVLAKGRARLFFWLEVVDNAAQLGLIVLGIVLFGLPGAGIGFLVFFVFYTMMIVFVGRYLTGFRWSPANLRLGLLTVIASLAAFAIGVWLPLIWSALLGGGIAAGLACYSMRTLTRLMGASPISLLVKKLQGLTGRQPA